MSHCITFRVLLLLVLPACLFMTSCEKFRKEIRSELSRGKTEKVLVSTCCWCIDSNTNNNLISNYISPKYCEDTVNDPTKSLASCKKIEVDAERCSFQKLVERANDRGFGEVDPTKKFREKRRHEDLRIHGSDEYITALSPQPSHCDRNLSATGESTSNDPRCMPESCKCFTDDTLPWNCELVVIRKDGKRESLGKRPKLERENGCDPTTCRELFAREAHAFCPSIQ